MYGTSVPLRRWGACTSAAYTRASAKRLTRGSSDIAYVVRQPAVPAAQLAAQLLRPLLRTLPRSLHQQRDVQEQARERRGCQRWEPLRHANEPTSLVARSCC